MAEIQRARALCEGFPGVVAEESGQHTGFSASGRRFAWLVEDHHGDGRVALHLKAAPGRSAELVAERPGHCFIPPYLGKRGWVGVWIDGHDVDWPLTERLVAEAHALSARNPSRGSP